MTPGALPSCLAVQDANGTRVLLLFGGRRHDGMLLNDVWSGRVEWPTIRWTLLHDAQAGVGAGEAAGQRAEGWQPAGRAQKTVIMRIHLKVLLKPCYSQPRHSTANRATANL